MSILTTIAGRAASFVMPAWAPWAAGVLLVLGAYGLGTLHEARRGAAALADYKGKQVAQTVKIVEKQVLVKGETQTRVVERIKKIYVQGATIETNIPTYITPIDTGRFAVNDGWVRIIDAAWAGNAVGPAAESDREPAAVPLDSIAAVQTQNATACRAWREQALGWRDYYRDQQIAVNGKAGDWWLAAPANQVDIFP